MGGGFRSPYPTRRVVTVLPPPWPSLGRFFPMDNGGLPGINPERAQ